MSLIVEDGSGLAGAEAYGTVVEADAYHTPRGNGTTWSALTTEVKERHLRNATDFMVRVYRARWAGTRVSGTQALDWPRHSVCVDGWSILSTVVPTDVKRACFELALRASDSELIPDLETGSNQIKREKIGPLDTEFFQNNVEAEDRFPAVNAILEPYFGTAGGDNTLRLVRG